MDSPTPAPAPPPTDGVVTFTLSNDPIDYKLSFDFNEICKAEEVTDLNLMAAFAGRSINAAQTRALLYAFLRPHHDVLLIEAGILLSRDMSVVLDAMSKVINQANRDITPPPPPPPPAAGPLSSPPE